MRWDESGKLNITASDLALLKHNAFREKSWAKIDSWTHAENACPPILSAMLFCLLSGPDDPSPKMFWMRYRRLLEVSNHTGAYYRQHTISTHGKSRTIYEPLQPLAGYQRWILKNVLEKVTTTKCAYAYKKGVSLVDNARVHQGHAVVVKLDISHFFDSITYGMVFDVFANMMRYPREGATLLANLCCLEDKLPQGACTSPYLSNLCLVRPDIEIEEYCDKNHISYSRYSDDLTFSGDQIDVKALILFVRQVLRKYGFKLNCEKTHVDGKGRQHRVTGIICNDKINTPAVYRKQVRQEMYYLKKFGVQSHLKRLNDPNYLAENGEPDSDAYYSSLLGRIAYVLQVNPDLEEFLEYRQYIKSCLDKAQFSGGLK